MENKVSTYPVFLQPENKEVTPALCSLVCFYKQQGKKALFCCMPTDHKIKKTKRFLQTIYTAVSFLIKKKNTFLGLEIKVESYNKQLGYHSCVIPPNLEGVCSRQF